MFKLSLPAILLLVSSIKRVCGYAHYMLTNSQDCSSTPLKLGYYPIMAQGGTVMADTTGKTIAVTRNGVSLSSGSNYIPGETLTIGMNPFTSASLIFEAHGNLWNYFSKV